MFFYTFYQVVLYVNEYYVPRTDSMLEGWTGGTGEKEVSRSKDFLSLRLG